VKVCTNVTEKCVDANHTVNTIYREWRVTATSASTIQWKTMKQGNPRSLRPTSGLKQAISASFYV